MHPDTQGRVSTYSLALLAAAGAVALRWLLAPWLGDQRPLVTAVGAVAAAAWLGGLRPGLLAAALSVLGCGALFVPWGGPAAPGALLDPAADLASCAVVLGLGAGLWAARRRASVEHLAAAAADGRLQQAERAAQAAEERLAAVLASIDDHLVCYDRQWRYTYVNEHAARLLGKSRDELLGRCIWDLFPDAVGNQYYREVHEAAREQKVIRSEHFYPPFGMWFENYIYPTAGGVTVFASDVTERKRAEQALREADQRKDDFLAMLAHELRNPLAPISNALHLLRLSDGEGERGRVLAMCERQVRHLVRLVDDLLEVSRITRGKIDLRKERVELADVVHSAVETSRPLIEAASHRLDLDLPAEAVALEADPVRLAQVIANLLNNAARYTDAGGHIRLAARREGGDVVLSVRDDGVGIPADLLPRVFDLFTQGDTSLRRAQGGLGIGLTLVRSLVQMHGGSVEAHSGGPGRGSELVVRLPAAPELAADPAGAHLPALDAPTSTPACRILVVDDNTDAAESLGLLLQLQGHEVRLAHDGHAALAAVHAHRPQVVLLDIGLPGLDGYEVARRLRRELDGGPLRLIALTGYGQAEDRRRTREAGFDYHLVKPVDPAALAGVLDAQPPASGGAPALPAASGLPEAEPALG